MKIKRTNAAILVNSHQDLVVDEIELPSSLESGQVLVELISSGICGAQLNEIDATKGVDRFLPHLLGHEGVCQVIERAPDVSRVKVGDTAIMHWRKGIGINANTAQYRWNGKNLNAGWVTTFNHHSIVSENRLTKISNYESISPAILPLLGCALTTAYGIASKETLPKQDDTILILGTGGVGLALIAILRTLKNERIIAVDKDVKKLKVASNLGASYTIKFTSKEQSKSDINLLLNQVGADIAIETTGKVSCIELAYEATKEDGFVNLVGVPDSNHKASLYTLPLHYGKILRGTDGGSSDPDVDIPLLIELLVNKSLILDSYPLTTYTLNDINKAIYDIRDGQPGRSIIQF